MMTANTNDVVGLNVVGMRRMGLTAPQRQQIRQMYRLMYFEGLSVPAALARLDQGDDWDAPAVAFREFVRRCHQAPPPYNRGIARPRRGRRIETPQE
jgi:acyl-[acyl carrier protein]--UDP-N-acetylglucosamine O-acyltransferase